MSAAPWSGEIRCPTAYPRPKQTAHSNRSPQPIARNAPAPSVTSVSLAAGGISSLLKSRIIFCPQVSKNLASVPNSLRTDRRLRTRGQLVQHCKQLHRQRENDRRVL